MSENEDQQKVVPSNDEEETIQEIYDCNENPLQYMIEPKGSLKIVDKEHKTKKEDLENIL